MKRLSIIVCTGLVAAFGLSSCFDPTQKAEVTKISDSPGYEYAPQMYHSIPYDALTQTAPSLYDTREKEGIQWKSNTNYLNPHHMNMREPVKNTIAQNQPLPLEIGYFEGDLTDSMARMAGKRYPVVTEDLYDIDSAMVDGAMQITAKGEMQFEECKAYYQRFCAHCHGENADGKGPISAMAEPAGPMPGIANLKEKAKNPAGQIYHTITYGKNNMGSHASQLSQKERWMIVTYIKSLEN